MLTAQIRPGQVVAVRSAPNGAIVARLSARTEFGSAQTLAVTRTALDSAITGLRYQLGAGSDVPDNVVQLTVSVFVLVVGVGSLVGGINEAALRNPEA